ncbi:MAG: hypothetical protein NWF07_07640 [Candidatus Bathyarchaeota archaeon]|nr:hypothetical protein [Candidatus Bathyarchaeota archaeon]
MSYTYQQYGTGFQLQMPTPEAQQFNELLQIRGTPATIINRNQTGTTTYGNPTYTETTHQTNCFRRTTLSERNHPSGNLTTTRETILIPRWAPVKPIDEIELDGTRYHITDIHQTTAYTYLTLEKKQ